MFAVASGSKTRRVMPDARLRSAIDTLYARFASIPAPTEDVPCTHCVSPQRQARIRAVPLRELQGAELVAVAGNAGVGTFGDRDVYRYFLPRLFEAALLEDVVDAGLVLQGLVCHLYTSWPSAEQQAVNDAITTWIGARLGGYDDIDLADTLVIEQVVDLALRVHPQPEALLESLRELDDVSFTAVWRTLRDASAAGARERYLPLIEGLRAPADTARREAVWRAAWGEVPLEP